jgi:hypothetical protein
VTILERTVAIEVRADALLFADYHDFGVPRGGSLTREAILSWAGRIGEQTARSIRVALNGTIVPLVVEDVGLLPPERSGPGRVRIRLAAKSDDPIRDLVIDYGLFREHDPAHRGYARIRRDADEVSYVFARGVPFRWSAHDGDAPLPKARAWLGFLLDGIEHILAGLDHVLFLFGLVVAAKSAGSVVRTVTGFTLAHSLTLGIGAAGVVALPRAPVEVAIALSIAWVGIENLRDRGARGSRWLVTIVFGLVHGLGFSEALADATMPAADFAAALVLFNVGVEAGQLMLLLLVLPPLAWLRERAPRAHKLLIVRLGSLAIAIVGLVWAVSRAIDASG